MRRVTIFLLHPASQGLALASLRNEALAAREGWRRHLRETSALWYPSHSDMGQRRKRGRIISLEDIAISEGRPRRKTSRRKE